MMCDDPPYPADIDSAPVPEIPADPMVLQSAAVSALQAATDSLRQTALLRAIPEASPDALMAVNDMGRIEYVNLQFELMFGYHRSEVIGKYPEMLLPREIRERHIDHRTRYFNSPSVREMGERQHLEAARKNGTRFRVLIRLSPLVIPEGMFTIAAIRRPPDAS